MLAGLIEAASELLEKCERLLFRRIRKNRDDAATMRKTLITILAIACIAGAVWTAYWCIRFGLAPRPPLSLQQTALRVLIVIAASVALWIRRDPLERATLVCTIVAAGASTAFGFGVRSIAVDVTRLLFHLVAYTLGAVVCVRWLKRS